MQSKPDTKASSSSNPQVYGFIPDPHPCLNERAHMLGCRCLHCLKPIEASQTLAGYQNSLQRDGIQTRQQRDGNRLASFSPRAQPSLPLSLSQLPVLSHSFIVGSGFGVQSNASMFGTRLTRQPNAGFQPSFVPWRRVEHGFSLLPSEPAPSLAQPHFASGAFGPMMPTTGCGDYCCCPYLHPNEPPPPVQPSVKPLAQASLLSLAKPLVEPPSSHLSRHQLSQESSRWSSHGSRYQSGHQSRHRFAHQSIHESGHRSSHHVIRIWLGKRDLKRVREVSGSDEVSSSASTMSDSTVKAFIVDGDGNEVESQGGLDLALRL